jgi:hypothetical protein
VSPAVVGLLSAGLVGLLSAATTWISIRANGRERRKDQRATWARDDEVARKAAEAAALLLAAQKATIDRTDEVARTVAAANTDTAAKLEALDVQGKAIHVLVNQKLTDVTERALGATLALLEVLESTAADQAPAGRPLPPGTEARIERARREVAALRGTLADRAEQQAVVDANQLDEPPP